MLYDPVDRRESDEDLVYQFYHPPKWLYPVESIGSSEAFGSPLVVSSFRSSASSSPLPPPRRRRALRPSEPASRGRQRWPGSRIAASSREEVCVNAVLCRYNAGWHALHA